MSFSQTLLVNTLSLLIGGLLGYLFAELQQFYGKRKDKLQAAALMRLETEMNLLWLDEVIKTKVYFRDEAFLEMRKNGFLSYLPRPLPFLAARTYDKLYQVNDLSRRSRNGELVPEIEGEIAELRRRMESVNAEIDNYFPSISRNYGPPPFSS
jgi:hypothetical protein